MNTFLVRLNSSESLASVAPGLILIGKLTLLLALAWLAHPFLGRYNPRWRVALWRGVVAGLALICVFSMSPPLVRWRILPDRAATEPQIRDHLRASLPPIPRPVVQFVKGTLATVRQSSHTIRTTRESVLKSVRSIAPEVPTEIRPEQMAWPRLSIAGWLIALWGIGCVVSLGRLIGAMLQVSRLRRSCEEVAPWIAAEASEIASRIGCKRRVVVRESCALGTPCLFGLRTPTLMIPGTLIDTVEPGDLRAILAHELSHARNNDLFWNLSAHLASIVLWFHPLAWKLQSAHAAACEAVSDAVAADCVGDTRAYVRTLARIALLAVQPPPAQGLAMVRISEVLQRIEAMNRHLFRQPLPRNGLIASGLVGAALAVLIGRIRLSRAEQPVSKSIEKAAAEAPGFRIGFHAVEAATGKPLEGIGVEYQGWFDGKQQNGTVKTGKDGRAVLEWKNAQKIQFLTITASKSKLVPVHFVWRDDDRPIKLPAEQELRLEPGTSLDGQVRDEAGQPIADATVEILIPAKSEMQSYYYHIGQPKTDSSGRWHIDEAPANLQDFLLHVRHPRYLRNGGHAARSRSIVTVLKQGLTLSGRILDRQGKPLKGAQAILNHDIWGSNPPRGKTDEQGRFVLENCPRGPTIVTAQADGYAPQLQNVVIDDNPQSPEFRLGPGSTVRVKFVDPSGKPIEGASLNADTWHGHRSLDMRANSGPDGRVEWRGAPPDPVIYHCYKPGLMRIPDLSLAPSENEQVVTMHPPLEISGRVTDARTGRPVPSFRAIRGMKFNNSSRVHWMREGSAEFTDGRYLMKTIDGYPDNAIRIEAVGYRPAESRIFKPEEGTQSFDFSLEPAQGVAGIVLGPDNRPAKGIDVAITTSGNHISIHNSEFNNSSDGSTRAKTDDGGKFAFPGQEGSFVVFALGESGYAYAYSEEFEKSGKLVLKPWGRIRGQVQIGQQLGSFQEVTYQAPPIDQNLSRFVMFGGNTMKADEKGRFFMDRVFPGKGSIGRVVVTEYGGGISQHQPCWLETVEVIGGETSRVTVGGRGRPVTGRIAIDSDLDAGSDWRRYTTVNLQRRPGRPDEGRADSDRFVANIDKAGRFRIDDVPPGDYQLSLSAERPLMSPLRDQIKGVGELQRDFTVPEIPEVQTDDEVDLGTLTAKLVKPVVN